MMNLKKQIVRGGGVALLAAFMVVTAPTLAAEPGQTSAPFVSQTSLVAQRPSGGGFLRTMWSTSNEFGTGQAWVENTRAGSIVSHVSFTSLNGETLHETFTSRQIKMVSGAGTMDIKRLANGHLIETVFVRPGACESEPRNMAAVTAATASIELDAHGNPFHSLQSEKFSSAQKAFACGTAAVRSAMHSSLAEAGFMHPASGSAVPRALSGLVVPGQAHTDMSGACLEAAAELGLAEAALAVALAGEVATIGFDTPAVVLAMAGYVVAAAHYEQACG